MRETPHTQAARKKLPASYAAFIMPLCLTCMMTAVVSCISTLNSVGLIDGFLRIWLKAWGISWMVAFPVMKLLFPIAQRFTQFLVESPPQKNS